MSTLVYAMGDCADDILQTLQINEENASYEDIKKTLNDYYAERCNVIIERARFNKRSQIPGGIDTFVQGVLDDSLYLIVCNLKQRLHCHRRFT